MIQLLPDIYFEDLLKTKAKIDFELYLRSDNFKSLQFFIEFEEYFKRLKSIINFIPIYRYYYNEECESSLNFNEESDGHLPLVIFLRPVLPIKFLSQCLSNYLAEMFSN